MPDQNDVSPANPDTVEMIVRRVREEIRKHPEVSDEEFMAEFEVSEEEYERGIVMPGIG